MCYEGKFSPIFVLFSGVFSAVQDCFLFLCFFYKKLFDVNFIGAYNAVHGRRRCRRPSVLFALMLELTLILGFKNWHKLVSFVL